MRKLLTMNGAFHQSSDINRLYVKRVEGGCGLKNIEDLYECRTILLLEHHGLLKLVREHKGKGIVQLGNEFNGSKKHRKAATSLKELKRFTR